jgi:hypothetical protein
MTPSGIEPATLRFVAHCLNHCATACAGKYGMFNATSGDQVSASRRTKPETEEIDRTEESSRIFFTFGACQNAKFFIFI